MNKQQIFDALKHGLVVSCQALPDEPLHSPYIMRCMAQAAQRGGASGIRANSVSDICEIMSFIDLPVIGIIKTISDDNEVYITPTLEEVSKLAATNVHIIAMDATSRRRPGGVQLDLTFPEMKAKYPNILFMADCSSMEDALRALSLGFDMVSTTLRGYTPSTKNIPLPDFEFISELVRLMDIPVVAEGGIHSPDQLQHAMSLGVHCCVVGSAITRPQEITQRFVSAIWHKS